MKIKGIITELMVRNVGESVNFYEQVLGFRLIASDKEYDEIYWALMQRNDFLLSFKDAQRQKAEASFMQERKIGGTVSLCFRLDEPLRPFYDRIVRHCQTLNHPHITPCGANEFSMRDPSGYILTFEQFDEPA